MKVLLTGATGFLGKNLKDKLSLYHELVGVGSEWDLRKQDVCERLISKCEPDAVIHAAGSVGGIGANQDNPGKFIYENLIMGTNVIHQSMLQNVSKFILLGTVCAYPKYTTVPFKEEDIWNGYPEETNAPYGIAKKALMQMVQSYHEQYGFNGINLIPVNMYGPHDHFNLTSSHVIPALILKIHKAIQNNDQEIVIWGTGNASREFLFAEDCAEAISLALEKDIPPVPINVGTGKEIKILELVKMIAQIMGFQGIIRCDESKPDGQPRRCLDTSRAKELLGFKAQTDLPEGLSKTINWFLENGG